MYTPTNNGYIINQWEYFFNVNEPYYTPNTIQAHVPTFMPNIPMGVPKVSKVAINRGMFCNGGDCKVTPSNTVSTQNYITLPHHRNESPSFPDKKDRRDLIPRYNKFILEVLNGDIRKIFFTGKL